MVWGKKGQAAMEFLITYGWAILAAIVSIAVLAYFGVFNPANISGDRIIIGPPFHAIASQLLITPGEVNFEMSNRGTKTVTLNAIAVNGTGPSNGINCGTNPAVNFVPDIINLFNVPCVGALTRGDTYIGDITIYYQQSGSILEQVVTGKIKAVVQ